MMSIEDKILQKKFEAIYKKWDAINRKHDAVFLQRLEKYKGETQKTIHCHKPENEELIMQQLIDNDMGALVALRAAALGDKLTTAQKNRLCLTIVTMDGFDYRLASFCGDNFALNSELFDLTKMAKQQDNRE